MTRRNPLDRQGEGSGNASRETLEETAQRLNGMGFSKALGRRYFVGQRQDSKGNTVHFLDCR